MGKKKLEIGFIESEFEKCGYKLLTTEYINCTQKLKYVCPKGHEYSTRRDTWQKGNRCPACAGQAKPDFSIIKQAFEKEGYELISPAYVNDRYKMVYKCPVGHIHSMRWGNFRHGKRCPTCAIINNRLNKTGPLCYNWKGGITPFNKELRNFVRCIGWNSAVFKRDNYICLSCGKRGGYLIAHHIIPLSAIRENFNIGNIEDVKDCAIIYDISNGVTLCKKCHKLIHDQLYFRRNLVLCLRITELMELSSGLYEPFVKEILRRNPSNSGKPQTDDAVGNPERSPKGNVQRSVERRRLKRAETGETLNGFDMIYSHMKV